ncbi:unnamed protein product [Rotaria sordida]|uniref:Uncharacterized protein n=1 Tax=Rotaria sordida TaxID=392033 RepID=A0A815Z4V4_9BILA|nr:unnamed protein product [Rotaria sordida]CAF1310869.1 unnamed protein product [Rotaria sordida]CAF1580247.1 unnamed protein product [Rotaria sordida]CAF1580267.1 unnamed protein product [Rotaria sordida]
MTKKLIIHLLLATFAIVSLCAADDASTSSMPVDSANITNLKPDCSMFPLPPKCDPCKYAQPIKGVVCGQGLGKCALKGGTCKINRYDQIYCCPYEHAGCCPIVYFPPDCYSECTTDAQCQPSAKCCGIPCQRCIPAIY